MKTHMSYRKYLFILSLIGSFFIIAPLAFASSTHFVSMTQFPAFNYSASGGLSMFINILYKYLIGIAAILAVLEITWGGFLWMGSGASITSKQAGRNKIIMALTGLLLVLSPVIIFSIINPSILSLKLETSKIQITQQKANESIAAATPAIGCTLSASSSLLKKYICSGVLTNVSAKKYCTGDLSQPAIKCSLNNSNGECTTKTLYCSSGPNVSSPVLKAYELIFKYSSSKRGAVGKKTFFPKSAKYIASFKKTCSVGGGVVNETLPNNLKLTNSIINLGKFKTKEILDQMIDEHKILSSTLVSPFPCTGYPIKTIAHQDNLLETYCYKVNLSCIPPSN